MTEHAPPFHPPPGGMVWNSELEGKKLRLLRRLLSCGRDGRQVGDALARKPKSFAMTT